MPEDCSNYIDRTTRCPEPAAWRRYYPGQPPDYVCDAHMRSWSTIADTMGFEITFVKLDPETDDA